MAASAEQKNNDQKDQRKSHMVTSDDKYNIVKGCEKSTNGNDVTLKFTNVGDLRAWINHKNEKEIKKQIEIRYIDNIENDLVVIRIVRKYAWENK